LRQQHHAHDDGSTHDEFHAGRHHEHGRADHDYCRAHDD
jgi:hypothetical protein